MAKWQQGNLPLEPLKEAIPRSKSAKAKDKCAPLLLFFLNAILLMSPQEPWSALEAPEIPFRRGATLAFRAPASMEASVSRVQVLQDKEKGSPVSVLPCSLEPDVRPGETRVWTPLAEMGVIVSRGEGRCSAVAVLVGRGLGARSTRTTARAIFARMEDSAETEQPDTLVTVLEVGSFLWQFQAW